MTLYQILHRRIEAAPRVQGSSCSFFFFGKKNRVWLGERIRRGKCGRGIAYEPRPRVGLSIVTSAFEIVPKCGCAPSRARS